MPVRDAGGAREDQNNNGSPAVNVIDFANQFRSPESRHDNVTSATGSNSAVDVVTSPNLTRHGTESIEGSTPGGRVAGAFNHRDDFYEGQCQ